MQPNTCQPNTFTPLLRSRRLGTTMGLTGILSAIMARALGGSTMFRAGVSRAVRGCKSIHDFKRMAHSHPRRARLYAPSGERLKPTTEQTNAPCSCQPVPAFQVTLVTPIWRPDLKCAAVRWACQHFFRWHTICTALTVVAGARTRCSWMLPVPCGRTARGVPPRRSRLRRRRWHCLAHHNSA